MSGILDILGSILGSVTGLLTGGITELISHLTENLVTVGLLVFAIALGFFAIAYLNRRRKTMDAERLAIVLKSLHRSGLSRDVLNPPKPVQDSRAHLLSGLRWLFGGVGLSSAMYGYQSMQPLAAPEMAASGALIGLIPGALGLAHLLFSLICSRCQAAQQKAAFARAARPAFARAGRRF